MHISYICTIDPAAGNNTLITPSFTQVHAYLKNSRIQTTFTCKEK